MNRNERTPRTLADTVFCTGYTSAQFAKPRNTLAEVAFAVALGIFGAIVLVWSI